MRAKSYIFILLYFISVIGITLDYHYCGGEFVGITLIQFDEDNCCGDEEEEEGCCEDKYVSIDTDDTEDLKEVCIEYKPFSFFLSLDLYLLNKSNYRDVVVNATLIPLNHAPPNSYQGQIYKENCVYLI